MALADSDAALDALVVEGFARTREEARALLADSDTGPDEGGPAGTDPETTEEVTYGPTET